MGNGAPDGSPHALDQRLVVYSSFLAPEVSYGHHVAGPVA